MKRFLSAIIILVLVLSLAACANTSSQEKVETTTASESLSSSDVGEFQTQLEEILKEEKFRGVVRVSKNGVILCEAANETLSPDSSEEITIDSQFAIGSVSKQFTAACIMLLKEEGKLNVDDTIDKWYPDYQYAKDITVKNLLTMCSGIPDYVNDANLWELASQRYDFSKTASEEENRKVSRDVILSQELEFTPDSDYAYSNSNYFLLAEIVEQVSQKSFSDYLKENFLIPLQMTDTGVAEELSGSGRLVPNLGEENDIQTKGLCFGDGGIISTAADMDRWMTSLREHTVLSEDSVNEMTTDYSPQSGHYGYGLFISSDGAWWHAGAVDSYLTHMYTVPAEGYNLFASTNKMDLDKMNTVTLRIKQDRKSVV